MTGGEVDYQDFLKLHKAQMLHIGLPEHYHRTLWEKVQAETYDSGDYFMMMTDGRDWEVQATRYIDPTDANTVFLIDHTWTFHPEQCRSSLLEIPGLVQRVTGILPRMDGEEGEEESEEEEEEEEGEMAREKLVKIVDRLSERVWDAVETYTVQKDEEKTTVCYLMDEFGSRVGHSDTPNVKFAPFFHITKQFALSLMWPIDTEEGLEAGTVITRDIAFGEEDPGKRAARLAALPDHRLSFSLDSLVLTEEKVDPFKMYGRREQTLADLEGISDKDHPANLRLETASPIKVCTDLAFMATALTDPLFEVVSSQEDADMLFSSVHFDQFAQLHLNHPAKVVNQFPSENILCCKDLLLKVGRRCTVPQGQRDHADQIIRAALTAAKDGWADRLHPWWMPIGFDLVNELPAFVRHYLENRAAGRDNTWIVKPWNMARGQSTYVTRNLSMLVKLAYTSPKIVQKYIERPVLFYRGDVGRVKFDIRYVILLRSVQPLRLFKYNVFWLRFANQPFSLNNWEEYEKHFTVMNYQRGAGGEEGANLKQIHDVDFVKMFEQQYPDHPWEEVDGEVCRMFRECFESACSLPPPKGLGRSPQSRAIYAADFMLKWEEGSGERKMVPQMLEINFNPDNQRACKYHPDFYNHCLTALTRDQLDGIPVTEI